MDSHSDIGFSRDLRKACVQNYKFECTQPNCFTCQNIPSWYEIWLYMSLPLLQIICIVFIPLILYIFICVSLFPFCCSSYIIVDTIVFGEAHILRNSWFIPIQNCAVNWYTHECITECKNITVNKRPHYAHGIETISHLMNILYMLLHCNFYV